MHENIDEIKEVISDYDITYDKNAREIVRNEAEITRLMQRNLLLVRQNKEIVGLLFHLRNALDKLLEETEN